MDSGLIALLHQMPLMVKIVFAVIAGLFIYFLVVFVGPALRTSKLLKDAIRELRELRAHSESGAVTPKEITDRVMKDGAMRHLWDEYVDTLHEQRTFDPTGALKYTRWRSTLPAETFFSTVTLVDVPLKSEFFKHLPGIFTGVGIIGTFLGLITGLQGFEITEDSNQVRKSLDGLVSGVKEAFYVSISAILLAMLATFIEKLFVSHCYKQVEEICQLIDGMFDAGAGEEYLARLVKAAESSATQTLQLKESLVGELKEILSELTQQQIEANRQNSSNLANTITKTIGETLKEPLDQISAAVNKTTANQGDAVNKLLTDVLSAFTADIQKLFGGQMTGMNELLQQTISALQTTVSKFDQLATNIDSAGKNAADSMADRLDKAMVSLESRQQIMNSQMAEFVEQIRNLVKESQTETSQKLQQLLGDLGQQMSLVVKDLQNQSQQAASQHEIRQQSFMDQSSAVVGGMGAQMEQLVQKSAEASEAMKQSIQALREVTTDSINRMNAGSETMYVAASEFSKAGEGVTGVMQQAAHAVSRIETASGGLASAMENLEKVVADYQATRDSIRLMLEGISKTVENAKAEAGLTESLVESLRRSSDQLVEAQDEATKFLEQVTEVLADSYEKFKSNMESSVSEANNNFHAALAKSTNLLATAVQNLSDVVDDIPRK